MITAVANNYRWDPHKEAMADLIMIALFYLLHVGEYTFPSKPWEKQTIAMGTVMCACGRMAISCHTRPGWRHY
jgi:hypothetical protein